MTQRSLDSYFIKKTVAPQAKPKTTNKRKVPTISSDDEESPTKSETTAKKRHKVDKSPASKKDIAELKGSQNNKPASVTALFGGELRRESKQKEKAANSPKKADNDVEIKLEPVSNSSFSTPSKSESESHTLRRSLRTPKKPSLLLDEQLNAKKIKTPEKQETIKNDLDGEVIQLKGKTPTKHKSVTNELHGKMNAAKSPKTVKEKRTTPVKEKSIEKKTSPGEINQNTQASQRSAAKNKKHPKTDLETSVLSDEERFERKRIAAILYQKHLNRETVINPGSKEVPKGKPNCLAGISFCLTGVLESVTREEAAEIVKDLGGKLSASVGKRLNYLVAGEDAGPKKLADAESLGIPILSIDGLFDLIREKSNNKIKNEPKTSPLKRKTEKSPFKAKRENIISPTKIKKEKIKEEIDINTNLENLKTLANNDVIPKPVDDDNIAWVDKYKPILLKQIIGQQGAASNSTKLINWLKNWHSNQNGGKKLQKPNPWAKNDDGSYYKAALLSGPPGVGKTTTAILVCKELGFDTVEFNASDTRSKRLLKEEVSELLSNKSLYGYFHGNEQAVSKKHVLIMDEVDGMAGNEDRGGIQELIALIKDSHVPIICMCNDRNHQKMRSLVNYCYDLRFNKPRLEQIRGFLKSICFKEKIKLSSEKIDEIILATNNDIRQSINHLCLLSSGKDLELTSSIQKTAQKDLKMGPWEVVRKVFSVEEHKQMSLGDKLDLFFHDYSMAPLFVQQNYLMVSPSGPKSEVLKKVALSADALSLGDLIDRRIRTNSAWTLLPVQAVFSSFFPGEYMEGHFTGQINFPGWLGKFSRTNKRSRLAQEIHDHTRLRTSGSRLSIRLDYAPFLLSHIVRPLKEKAMEGVEESLKVIQEYRLLREDIDSLIELTTWPGKKSLMDAVDGRVKAALTRSYNKEVLPYSYSAVTAAKKKKTETADGDIGLEMMENETEILESDEENDNLENDNLIKAKKTTSSSVKPSTSKSKKSSASQKKASGKSRK